MQYDYGKNKTEHPDPVKAKVKGSLPEWLQGTLVRNGPGLFSFGETSYNHWFDGMALLHSFTISRGEVTYCSKYLKSDTYNSNMEANRIVVSEMGTMAYPHPSKNVITKVISFFNHTVPDFTDNCAGNIIKYGSDYYATSETNYIRKINPMTLETQDKVDYRKYIPVTLVISHPHYDKEGNTYNMGTSIADKGKTKYIIFKVPAVELGKTQAGSDWTPALKNAEILATLPCRSLLNPSYYHSFGMTENYFIFTEQPLKLDIVKMATAYMRGVSWASCMKFQQEDVSITPDSSQWVGFRCYSDRTVVRELSSHPNQNCRKISQWLRPEPFNNYFFHFFPMEYTMASVTMVLIHLIDRRTRKEVDLKCYTNTMVVYHHVNAFEEDGHVILDVIAYDDNRLFEMFYLDNLKKQSASSTTVTPQYKRFVFPLSDKCTEMGENLVKLKNTTATAVKGKDGRLICQPEVITEGTEVPRINYNYNGQKHRYAYVTETKNVSSSKVIKFDVETKLKVEWSTENCLPIEPVFVPRPDAIEEDDGVVLTTVINSNQGEADFLLVLDGKSFQELARASVNVELHIDMHGFFIPQQDAEALPTGAAAKESLTRC